ncbi:MAG: sugar phosphate isomerase/epimerase, partial [Tepidisphaeraceae bacterium]
MSLNTRTRRRFLQETVAVAGSLLLAGRANAEPAEKPGKLHLACNHYPWLVFYRRDKRDFDAALDVGLAEVAQSGVNGFEPILSSPAQADKFASLL